MPPSLRLLEDRGFGGFVMIRHMVTFRLWPFQDWVAPRIFCKHLQETHCYHTGAWTLISPHHQQQQQQPQRRRREEQPVPGGKTSAQVMDLASDNVNGCYISLLLNMEPENRPGSESSLQSYFASSTCVFVSRWSPGLPDLQGEKKKHLLLIAISWFCEG